MNVVTLREAARRIERNYKTVFYHFKRGRIPAERVGGVWLVDVEAVANALEACQRSKVGGDKV